MVLNNISIATADRSSSQFQCTQSCWPDHGFMIWSECVNCKQPFTNESKLLSQFTQINLIIVQNVQLLQLNLCIKFHHQVIAFECVGSFARVHPRSVRKISLSLG